jgi:hypothetical protein
MKKIMFIFAVFVALTLAGIYLFIPRRLKIGKSIIVRMPIAAVHRSLSDDNSWSKWWPGEKPFIYKDYLYKIHGKIFNATDLDIITGKDTLKTRLELVMIAFDSTMISWSGVQPGSNNPFSRLVHYRKAASKEKNMKTILESMKSFLENPEKIYGLKVREKKVNDSVLISTRRAFDHWPTSQDIDAMIQRLKDYIKLNKAAEKNSPMLNVLQTGISHYEAMVAIAVDQRLPETKEFVPKFLVKGGNILETEIKGGPFTIIKAMEEFENYRYDYKYTSPAIPFQLLVTDRIKEADTTRWVTRLYYPVF